MRRERRKPTRREWAQITSTRPVARMSTAREIVTPAWQRGTWQGGGG